MNNSKKKIIRDDKTIYLIRSLSRTKRKDYENYVINAIWNRLNRDIEIVTQQYVYNPKSKNGKKRHFIDLYFPDLKLGIECDEAHHKDEKNIKADEEREASIYDAFHGIYKEEYKPIHIDVTLPYEKLQKEIDDTVKTIQKEIKKTKKIPKWEVDAKKFYSKKQKITIKDKMCFKTIRDACGVLFSYDYKDGRRNCYFYPDTFDTQYAGYKAWFLKLQVLNKNEKEIAAKKKGWVNKLLNGGEELIECKKNKKLKLPNEKRVVFAKYEDPLRDKGYKFIGIYKCEYIDTKGNRHYRRIEETFKIIR